MRKSKYAVLPSLKVGVFTHKQSGLYGKTITITVGGQHE